MTPSKSPLKIDNHKNALIASIVSHKTNNNNLNMFGFFQQLAEAEARAKAEEAARKAAEEVEQLAKKTRALLASIVSHETNNKNLNMFGLFQQLAEAEARAKAEKDVLDDIKKLNKKTNEFQTESTTGNDVNKNMNELIELIKNINEKKQQIGNDVLETNFNETITIGKAIDDKIDEALNKIVRAILNRTIRNVFYHKTTDYEKDKNRPEFDIHQEAIKNLILYQNTSQNTSQIIIKYLERKINSPVHFSQRPSLKQQATIKTLEKNIQDLKSSSSSPSSPSSSSSPSSPSSSSSSVNDLDKNILEAKQNLKGILSPFQKKLHIFNHVVEEERDSTPEQVDNFKNPEEQVDNFKNPEEHNKYINKYGSPFEIIVFNLSPKKSIPGSFRPGTASPSRPVSPYLQKIKNPRKNKSRK